MNQHRPYTPEENAYLRAHYATATREQVEAAVPGRTWDALQNQAVRLKATGRPLVVPVTARTVWHPANMAHLLTLYPAGGTQAVVEATGLSANAVRNQASRLRLRYVAQQFLLPRAPRPYRPRNTPKVEAAPARAPRPLSPVKAPRISTPNANAAKARKRRDEPVASSMAEAIARHKTLRYGQPEHTAFLRDGLVGWNQWKATQA